MALSIRPYEPRDSQALAKILSKVAEADHAGGIRSPKPTQTEYHALVALDEGNEPVGFAAVIRRRGELTRELNFALLPEHRMKGIGTKLVKQAVNHAMAQKKEEVYATTRRDLVHAVRVLEKTGFKLEREEGNYLRYVKPVK